MMNEKLITEALTPETLASLPEEVRSAITGAELHLAEVCKGRRITPRPLLVRLPVPEWGEDSMLFGVVVPPSYASRNRIEEALLRVKKGDSIDRTALETAQGLGIVECVYFVQGQPPAGDNRGQTVRNFLRELREERGALGTAWARFADAAFELLDGPAARLGKL